jgi:glycerol-3-phosphate dehydrogenase
MNGAVAEGVLTSRSAHALAQKLKVECPIMVSGVNCVNVTCLKLFGYNPAS